MVGGLKLTDNGVQLGGVWSLERKLENAADGCLLEANAPKKMAKKYYHQLTRYSANRVVSVEPAVRDEKTEFQRKAS